MAEILGFIISAGMAGYAAASLRRIGKPVKACVFTAGFFTTAVYLNQLCLLIMEGFRESVGENQMLDWLALLVSQSIMLGILLMQNGMETKEDSDRDRHRFDYADGTAVGLSAFFLLLAAEDFWTDKSVGVRFVLLALRFTALLIFYLAFLIFRKKQREEKTQEENLTRKREADTYLEHVENNYQRTRELWHDLKNHINLLKLLLTEEKYEQMADYLRVFAEDVDSLTLPVKSGNIIVDALLADKAARAKKEGVEVSLSLCNLTGLRMGPDDICGLLGNLLDNAIEANRQVEERRFIDVDCREQETCYYIQIKNAAAGRAVERDGYLLTSKTDRINRVGHGLGLRSVERIVHGLGGELAVESGETEFTAVVRIPK